MQLADTTNKVNEMIKDYMMMKREVARLEKIIFGYTIPMDNWGVAQYGIEAAMPKGSSGKSQAELKQMDLRERRQHNRLLVLRAKVTILESYTDSFSDLPTNIIYDRLLDGWTYRAIAEELNVSVTYVKDRKHHIIDVIVSAQKAQNAQNAQKDHFLQAQ
ncbi:sigma-70 family RNA polymerase sigma factor [Rummeliibacillus sp. POC4]|uniref:sigma-70 family RNA polymerase sigma factor n=1 Tax=Rummeliibacillus sp. POC4 TaxID=2305899 RepID=UPI000E67324C|nr:sigma-70 family RNA polymerase sigma factor [Rummeliibacillus sp. POC4]RIJ64075.1 sigma-70 family RNA polymerase sigma factor [Rummeliibacillus sp. POC4]